MREFSSPVALEASGQGADNPIVPHGHGLHPVSAANMKFAFGLISLLVVVLITALVARQSLRVASAPLPVPGSPSATSPASAAPANATEQYRQAVGQALNAGMAEHASQAEAAEQGK